MLCAGRLLRRGRLDGGGARAPATSVALRELLAFATERDRLVEPDAVALELLDDRLEPVSERSNSPALVSAIRLHRFDARDEGSASDLPHRSAPRGDRGASRTTRPS